MPKHLNTISTIVIISMVLPNETINNNNNILELNIPVLLGSVGPSDKSLSCLSCGDSLPSGQSYNSINIPANLSPTASKVYAGWAICGNCYNELLAASIHLYVLAPGQPEAYFDWLDFLKVTLGVCLNQNHSAFKDSTSESA